MSRRQATSSSGLLSWHSATTRRACLALRLRHRWRASDPNRGEAAGCPGSRRAPLGECRRPGPHVGEWCRGKPNLPRPGRRADAAADGPRACALPSRTPWPRRFLSTGSEHWILVLGRSPAPGSRASGRGVPVGARCSRNPTSGGRGPAIARAYATHRNWRTPGMPPRATSESRLSPATTAPNRCGCRTNHRRRRLFVHSRQGGRS